LGMNTNFDCEPNLGSKQTPGADRPVIPVSTVLFNKIFENA